MIFNTVLIRKIECSYTVRISNKGNLIAYSQTINDRIFFIVYDLFKDKIVYKILTDIDPICIEFSLDSNYVLFIADDFYILDLGNLSHSILNNYLYKYDKLGHLPKAFFTVNNDIISHEEPEYLTVRNRNNYDIYNHILYFKNLYLDDFRFSDDEKYFAFTYGESSPMYKTYIIESLSYKIVSVITSDPVSDFIFTKDNESLIFLERIYDSSGISNLYLYNIKSKNSERVLRTKDILEDIYFTNESDMLFCFCRTDINCEIKTFDLTTKLYSHLCFIDLGENPILNKNSNHIVSYNRIKGFAEIHKYSIN